MTNYYSDYLENQGLTTHSGASINVHNFDVSGKTPVQSHDSSSHTGTIGGESQITFSSSTGHAHTGSDSTVVSWSNISGRPTTTNAFTNDSGYLTGHCGYCGYCNNCFCACNCACNNCTCGGC